METANPSASELVAAMRDRVARIRHIDESSRKLLVQAADFIEREFTGAAPEAPASEQQATIPPCPHCEKRALEPGHKDGSMQHYQCGECLNHSHAATTASASIQKLDMTDYSTPVVYSNGTGRAAAPSRDAVRLDYSVQPEYSAWWSKNYPKFRGQSIFTKGAVIWNAAKKANA